LQGREPPPEPDLPGGMSHHGVHDLSQGCDRMDRIQPSFHWHVLVEDILVSRGLRVSLGHRGLRVTTGLRGGLGHRDWRVTGPAVRCEELDRTDKGVDTWTKEGNLGATDGMECKPLE
jgi:hypothetical protein